MNGKAVDAAMLLLNRRDGSTDALERRVDILWRLAEGTIYETQTDTQAACVKTVPSGAIAAGISSIGGNTVVWNQLNRNNGADGTVGDVSFARGTDGSWTVSGTATASESKPVSTYAGGTPGKGGHKYLVYNEANVSAYVSAGGQVSGMGASRAINGATIFTLSDEMEGSNLFMVFRPNTGVSYNTAGWLFYADLTEMFGAGNEPADTSDPRVLAAIAYAKEHRGYDTGSLLHAAVSSVVSKDGDAETVGTLVIPDAVRALEGYGQSEVGGDGNVLDLADGTYTEVGHYVDGVWTALDTPVTVDVSSMLPDNMLDAEAGGTLTFRQEGIAPFLSVASQVEYTGGAGVPVALPAGTKFNYGHKVYFSARAISADGVRAQSVSFERVSSTGTGFVFCLGGNTDSGGFIHGYWDGNYDAEAVVYTSDGTTSYASPDNIRLSVGPPEHGATPPVTYRLDGVRLLDLTEIFGKGNEPTSLSDTKLTALIGGTEIPVPGSVDYLIKLSEVEP